MRRLTRLREVQFTQLRALLGKPVDHATTQAVALGFVLRHDLLARLPAPPETWLWGTGSVAVDAPLVSYDEWTLDGLQVQVHYTDSVRADATVQHVDVCRSVDDQ